MTVAPAGSKRSVVTGLATGFILGAVIVIAHKAGRGYEAPPNTETTLTHSRLPDDIELAAEADSDPNDETNREANSGMANWALALASVVAQSYSPASIDRATGALTTVEQRAFQLELVSEWAATDGDAALLYASRLEPSLRRHALERVARVRAQRDPIDALRAERFLSASDTFEYRRSLLAEWAIADLVGVFDYLAQIEITADIASSLPHNELANDPARLLELAERTPGLDGRLMADTASTALQVLRAGQ